jgi:DinB superfamily
VPHNSEWVTRVQLLLAQMDEAYARLMARLDGLTDEELFWQPVRDCWTVYQDRNGRWTYHYAVPDPQPAPMTTIAWQLVHVALCKLMYHEWAFGAAQLTWPELETPHSVQRITILLTTGQRQLREDLVPLGEKQLDEFLLTNWGERWPAWRIFWTMIDHDALHTGAIGHLRDAYHWRNAKP